MDNVISLDTVRKDKLIKNEARAYYAHISDMDKIDLLKELASFQKERVKMGRLTLQLIVRGKILFKILEETAITDDLKKLAKTYKRYLDYELDIQLNKQAKNS